MTMRKLTSAGAKKDTQLVYDAFASVNIYLREIQMFHTDRDSEFNNQLYRKNARHNPDHAFLESEGLPRMTMQCRIYVPYFQS